MEVKTLAVSITYDSVDQLMQGIAKRNDIHQLFYTINSKQNILLFQMTGQSDIE